MSTKTSSFFSLVALVILSLPVTSSAQGNTSALDRYLRAKAKGPKLWSVYDVLYKPDPKKPAAEKYCNESVFTPALCPKSVPDEFRYRPALKECGGKAAIIVVGGYRDIFSVVVRDALNRDRFPPEGMPGCTAYETHTLGLSKCSAYKSQKRFTVKKKKVKGDVFCLGASGYDPLLSKITRMTAKLEDSPDDSNDPILRMQLKGPRRPLN